MPVRHFYLLSHYICYGLFFLFSVLLAPEGMNAIVFGKRLRGRGQKSTATQKVCLPAFLLALTLYLQWSILFIFCVLVPYGMNSIILGGIKGREIRSHCLLGRYLIRK